MKTLFFILVCATCSAQTSSFSQFVDTHPGMSKKEIRKAKRAWEKNEVRLFIRSGPILERKQKPPRQKVDDGSAVALLVAACAIIAYVSFSEP